MILSRFNSKTKWWILKVLSSLLVTILYSILIISLSKLLSHIIFESNISTSYAEIYYPNIDISLISPIKIEILLMFIFITGYISIITLFQIVNLLFNNTAQSYIFFVVLSVELAVLYKNNLIPRLFSPLYYPSILNLQSNISDILSCIGSNIILSVINIFISTIIINKKDYQKLNS